MNEHDRWIRLTINYTRPCISCLSTGSLEPYPVYTASVYPTSAAGPKTHQS